MTFRVGESKFKCHTLWTNFFLFFFVLPFCANFVFIQHLLEDSFHFSFVRSCNNKQLSSSSGKCVPNLNMFYMFTFHVKSQEKLMVRFGLAQNSGAIVSTSKFCLQHDQKNKFWIFISFWWPAATGENTSEAKNPILTSVCVLFWAIVRWYCTCIIALPFTSVFGLNFECEIVINLFFFCDRRRLQTRPKRTSCAKFNIQLIYACRAIATYIYCLLYLMPDLWCGANAINFYEEKLK